MPPDSNPLLIRPIIPADAAAASVLSTELGYPATLEAMERRIRLLAHLPDHGVYVACRAGAVLGWIDVALVHHLQVEPYGEIGGLVVSEEARSHGIGAALVSQGECWMRERGASSALVRSRISRAAAHRFYLRLGFQQTKTSAVFTKTLTAAG